MLGMRTSLLRAALTLVDHDPAHHHAHDAGEPQNRAAELPRGRARRSARASGAWCAPLCCPAAVDGIVTGCILAVGRIVGESRGAALHCGLRPTRCNGLCHGAALVLGATLTVALYVYANERGRVRRRLCHRGDSDAARRSSSISPPSAAPAAEAQRRSGRTQ